ncbi:MAG: MarR family transcriptional regulator [Micrococcales bacterium]|nr:MarR family transcriptional regulator [Micrococcales bacterium]
MSASTSLGNDLLRSAARLSRWASRNASFEVPFAQARLLALLEELAPCRISTLAAADHSSQPTITSQVHRLEASGLVDRRSDPADARASLVSLTTTGLAALERLRAARVSVLAHALEQLDDPAMERVRIAIEVMDELLAATATTTPMPLSREDG